MSRSALADVFGVIQKEGKKYSIEINDFYIPFYNARSKQNR